MKVVLLAGGLGTRIREETTFRPKPMVEVGGKPILWHIMKLFAHHGFKDFIVCIGYKGEVIREYFLDYEARNNDFTITLGRSGGITFHGEHFESDWRVTVADTGALTPTGGRIKMIEPYLGDDERFMVAYGDSVSDVDVGALVRFHESRPSMATVTTVRPTSRFGMLDVDERSDVRHFREKPQVSDFVSAGFFVFERAVLDLLDHDTVLEEDPLARLAREQQLKAFQHDGFWQPMDTYRESLLLNDLWDSPRPPWKVWAD